LRDFNEKGEGESEPGKSSSWGGQGNGQRDQVSLHKKSGNGKPHAEAGPQRKVGKEKENKSRKGGNRGGAILNVFVKRKEAKREKGKKESTRSLLKRQSHE